MSVEFWDGKWPAGRETELVSLKLGIGNTGPVIEEIVGIEIVVAQELEGITMEAIGARFSNGIHHISHAPTILSRKGVGLNLELLQLIHTRNINRTVPIAGAVPVSVQQEGGGPEAPAAKVEKGNILVCRSLAPGRIQGLILLAIVDT